MIAWEDAPHLRPPNIPQQELDDLEASLLPHQRQARRTGKPALGSGSIYPLDEDDLLVEPFPIPDFWPRAYALDVGWVKTAALWAAHDIDSDTYYLINEYYVGQQQPIIHAHAIKKGGPKWLRGCIDPAAEGSSQRDGRKLKAEYEDLGLHLVKANNAVNAGLHRVLVLMQAGQLKVFNTLTNWLKEFRLYRRDEKGKIVKDNDHLMDDMRYLLNTDGIFMTQPQVQSISGGRGEW